MKFQLPFEILKLFDIIEDPLTKEKIIDITKNYARYIQDNFDQIERYLNKKILGEEWTDWTPTYDAGGSMTYTSITTNYARYCIMDKMVFFMICAYGTTGGTANPTITFTLPNSPLETNAGGCFICDTDDLSGIWLVIAGDKIAIKKYNEANWGLGAARGFHAQGFYRIA